MKKEFNKLVRDKISEIIEENDEYSLTRTLNDKEYEKALYDKLLEEANVVGTPGSGFGPHGEGYFRLTAFNTKENTIEAVERIKNIRQ